MRYVSHWPSLTPLLFLAVYLPTGTRPARGFRKLSAYTRAKVRGTRTPATDTKGECNLPLQRGEAWAGTPRWRLDAFAGLPWHLHASSSFAPTSFTDVTATPGASGGRRERAA